MCVFNLDYFTVFIILRYWRLFKNLYAHLVRNKTKTICSLYPCLLDKISCFPTFSPLSGSQGRTEATAAIDIELITQSRGESRLKIITIMKKIPKPWITRLRPAVRIALVTQRKCREPPAGRRAAAKVLVGRADVTKSLTALPGWCLLWEIAAEALNRGFRPHKRQERRHRLPRYRTSRHADAAPSEQCPINAKQRRAEAERRTRWKYCRTALRAKPPDSTELSRCCN